MLFLSLANQVANQNGPVFLKVTPKYFTGLQAAVTPLGVNGKVLWEGYITLNMYTAAGWINVLLGIINVLLFTPYFFTERQIAAKEAMILSGAKSGKTKTLSIKNILFNLNTKKLVL